MDSRKPAKHQIARRVRVRKSDIMARRETKSMFSDIRLKASRGIRMGAPTERMSRAVRARMIESCSLAKVRAWRRRTR